MKYVEDIAVDVIPGLEILLGTPLVYELEADLKPIQNGFPRGSWQFQNKHQLRTSKRPMARVIHEWHQELHAPCRLYFKSGQCHDLLTHGHQ